MNFDRTEFGSFDLDFSLEPMELIRVRDVFSPSVCAALVNQCHGIMETWQVVGQFCPDPKIQQDGSGAGMARRSAVWPNIIVSYRIISREDISRQT